MEAGEAGPRQAGSHLWPALIALVLVAGALTGAYAHARITEARYIHALAPLDLAIKNQGSALQAEAFRQSDLLPLYGSSELTAYQGPFLPAELFKEYPTGFNVFLVGKAGSTALIVLQDILATAVELAGKKVVISISPTWFFNHRDLIKEDHYPGNFSRLHANEVAFGPALSNPFRRALARRLLDNPDTLAVDPLLEFALRRLADPTWPSRALYAAVWPLGQLQRLVLRLQDHYESLLYIRDHPDQPALEPAITRQPASLDWSSLRARAEQEARSNSSNNPYGIDNDVWSENAHRLLDLKGSRSTADFVETIQDASEWGDLDLLLRGLRDLGVQPLIMSMPINGRFYDFLGVSAQGRAVYYRRLRQVARPYDVPVLDFAEHDSDGDFLLDPGSHLSPKGWVYYGQALDEFVHDALR